MPKVGKGLTQEQIRAAQQEGGRMRLGPRVLPEDDADSSNTGYVARNFGGRNVKRNIRIQNKVARASAKRRRDVIEELADEYDLSTKTIEHIYRYFKTPEED